jgi:hypothetical protein
MDIIIVDHLPVRQIPYQGYSCQPSAQAAAIEFQADYGRMPEQVLVKQLPSGRVTCYIELTNEEWITHASRTYEDTRAY